MTDNIKKYIEDKIIVFEGIISALDQIEKHNKQTSQLYYETKNKLEIYKEIIENTKTN